MGQLNGKEDLGAVVTIVVDEKTGWLTLVMDPAKPKPHYWKFPGGKVAQEDIVQAHPFDDELTADNAALRETKEETGLGVQIIKRLKPVQKRGHTLYPRIGLANFEELVAAGEEGEIVKAFSLEEIYELDNFMPNHIPFLEAMLAFLDV